MTRETLWRATTVLSLLALTIAGLLLGMSMRRHQMGLRVPMAAVTFLDLSEGDCTIVRPPSGQVIMVDAGGPADGPTVVADLQTMNVRRIDLLILASPAEQCIGGVPRVLAAGIPVGQVWVSSIAEYGQAWSDAIQAVRRRHIPSRPAHSGDRIDFGLTALSIVWPPDRGPRARRDPLVVRVDYGDTSYLLDGPCDGDAENYLVAGIGAKLDCDILQVASGGAGDATSPELLRWSEPAIAVISCTADSPPAESTLHRLAAAGAAVWRTDTQGDITITATGHSAPEATASHL